MRLVDAVQGFPAILSALLFTAVFSPGVLVSMIAIGIAFVPAFARLTRGSFLTLREREFVVAARALGGGDRRVVLRHILPNSALPIITIGGIQLAGLLGGTVIIEQIFGLPGLGRYIYDAIRNRDYPVVQGVTLVLATIFVTVSMLVDILYAVVDPRLRRA